MLEVTETEACGENENQNYLGEGAIYFHTKALRGRGKIPPPTPDYDINYGRSLKGLPEIHPEEIDDVPGVSENGIRFCIECLGEKLGCGDYEYDLIQFWFLDMLTDCLWKAQDNFCFEEKEQKLILEWVDGFFKIIADPILNISRSSFLSFFKQILLKTYREIDETCSFPSFDVMSEFMEVSAVIEQMNGGQDETESSTTTSTSNPSASTLTIHSRDKLKISPDFDIAQHIKNLKSNNPLSHPYRAVSETQSFINLDDFSQMGECAQEDNVIQHYSNHSFTKNNIEEPPIMDYPNFTNEKTCYCKKHESFFCVCIKRGEEDTDKQHIIDIIDSLIRSIEIIELYKNKEYITNEEISVSSTVDSEEIDAMKEYLSTIIIKESSEEENKSTEVTQQANTKKDQIDINKDTECSIIENLELTKKTSNIAIGVSKELLTTELTITSEKLITPKPVTSKNKSITGKSKESLNQRKTSYLKEQFVAVPKKPIEVMIESIDNRDEEELLKEKQLLEEWAQFKLLEQRNINMDDCKTGWVPWNESLEASTHSIEDISSSSLEKSDEKLSLDSSVSKQRSLSFKILKAIIDFVFEYFYENFHFTLIQLAFRSTPNIMTQKLNEIWNVPKSLKQEIKRPKPIPKKKEKKSKLSKSSKKSSDKKSKSSKGSKKSKKDKKGKGKKKKGKVIKSPKLTKEERERLKREEALLEEEKRRNAENKLFIFPLVDAASEDLFMSIFENWVVAAKKKDNKKGKKDAKKKKKK